MARYEARANDRCSECNSPVTVEMDGIWAFRVCIQNGHSQSKDLGPLAAAATLFPARA